MLPEIWLEQARTRISPYLRKTTISYDHSLQTYIKWENLQVTGSFKARGALNKVLTLESWEREQGIVTASAGNHGQGVALAGKIVTAPVIVFASENASPLKLQKMRDLGAKLRLVPGGYSEAELAGLEFASRAGRTWVSAYNDGQVIAGQATLGMEVVAEIKQEKQLTWVIPCGGGGLLSGIAAFLRSKTFLDRSDRIIGVQSEASPFMYALYYYGTQAGVKELPSLADGLAGAVENNSLTIAMVRNLVDAIILVTEEEISQAVSFAWKCYQQRIEPAAAASLAAVLSGKVSAKPAVVIITGGNIQQQLHDQIIGKYSQVDYDCTKPQ